MKNFRQFFDHFSKNVWIKKIFENFSKHFRKCLIFLLSSLTDINPLLWGSLVEDVVLLVKVTVIVPCYKSVAFCMVHCINWSWCYASAHQYHIISVCDLALALWICMLYNCMNIIIIPIMRGLQVRLLVLVKFSYSQYAWIWKRLSKRRKTCMKRTFFSWEKKSSFSSIYRFLSNYFLSKIR